jgi:outer membrane lipoprotein-sorting protein
MVIIRFSIFSILVLVLALQNQVSGQEGRNPDPNAMKVLQALEKKVTGFQDLTYHFSLKVEIPESEPIFREGTFYTQGSKYRLEMGNYIFVTNGQSQWVVDKEASEVQIHDFEDIDENDLTHPQNLLALYNNPDFDYLLTYQGLENKKTVQKIEFKPLDRSSEYTKARLTIDQEQGLISYMEVFLKDGTRYYLTISDTLGNQNLAVSSFEVKKDDFPGYHIEDLRLN